MVFPRAPRPRNAICRTSPPSFPSQAADATAMLVGTCRVWRGTRTGAAFTALSPDFDTRGSGTCSGNEVNQIRALAVGRPTDSNGRSVIYATTTGLGPLDGPLNTRPQEAASGSPTMPWREFPPLPMSQTTAHGATSTRTSSPYPVSPPTRPIQLAKRPI